MVNKQESKLVTVKIISIEKAKELGVSPWYASCIGRIYSAFERKEDYFVSGGSGKGMNISGDPQEIPIHSCSGNRTICKGDAQIVA